jgi:hypothetical protein
MPVDINTCATPTSSKYKNTSLEVINDVYGGATEPVFPSAIKGSIHIVQYTDALIFYVKDTDGVWVETIDIEVPAPLVNKVANIKVALRGGVALTGNVMPMTTLMAAGNYIPLLEPYKGLGYTRVFFEDETVSALSVFTTNNITDWILVELRDKHNPSIVKYNRAALLRNDGQIMDIDGTTNLTFTGIVDDTYFVSIKHRNHIGLMTKDPVDITILLDFTAAATQVYGVENRLTDAGVSYLRAGKIYDGGPIQYYGDNGYAQNSYNYTGAGSLNTAVNGYSVFDLNLNGIVKLNLSSNDNSAFSNSNSDLVYLYSNVFVEQIPNINAYQFDSQIYFNKTSFQLPKGSASQRFFSPIGSIRYNTDTNKLEFNNGSAWEVITSV